MLGEVLLALVAALTGGGTVAGVQRMRRPPPGTPEDHERRIRKVERQQEAQQREIDEHGERLEKVENRMSAQENTVAGELARLTESSERVWQALERNTDRVDALTERVIEVDVETKVERSERHRRAGTHPEKE
jgi:uncharacterized coiled-coil protein SlyX